jgi:hypothetical protein
MSSLLILVCHANVLQAADVSILATWYREQGSCNYPVVIIIEDMERCSGSVLSDFILMLRYASAFFSSSHPPLLILSCVIFSVTYFAQNTAIWSKYFIIFLDTKFCSGFVIIMG